ncbi:MAG: DNA-processing protein DprA [Campylobacterales bacterium]
MIRRTREFPQSLKEIDKPPKELYYRGDISLLDRKKVSIVGTRAPNPYTKTIVKELSYKLSIAGVTVVSGGALGVDIIAHEAAYPNTIAIFANSLDSIYPKTNAKLIEKIYQNALALSESEENPTPKKYEFTKRNRIVTALGEVVIIAQADLKSGSLVSAALAKAQGKEIFVLPHRLKESEGTRELVKKGEATYIEDIDEFVNRFGELQVDKKKSELDGLKVEDAYKIYKERLFELELEGAISIENGRVVSL